MKKYLVTICLTIIILTAFFLMLFSSATDSLIIDEKVHIPAGYLHVWQGNYLFNTEHPPLLNDLAGLFAKLAKPNVPEIPVNFTGGDQWEYGDMFFYLAQNNVDKIIFWARLPFIFLTLGLIYLVFLWAKTLFGAKAGLLAAALTAFSPNILAHGRLATTDIGLAFFFLLACWLLRKYYLKPSWVNAAFLGAAIGLVLLSKFSGIVVLPVIFIGFILALMRGLMRGRSPQGERPRRYAWAHSFGQLMVIIFIPLILIWGVYAFSMRSSLVSPPQVYELSKTLDYKALNSGWSKWSIIPYDKFIQGFEIISDHNTAGHWSYLNGKVDYTGWWYYFPLVMLYKMTLVEIILLAMSIIFWSLRANDKKRVVIASAFRHAAKQSNQKEITSSPRCHIGAPRNDNNIDGFDYFLLIFPPLLFLAISITSKIDIGIRHILPILPFLYIFIGGIFYLSLRAERSNLLSQIQNIAIGLVIAQITIGILAFPNYIAYFNQIAGGAKGGIKHLADSNLDWNQNMKRFGEYAKQNNIKKVYELCWDGYGFSYQGVESEILPNNPVNGTVVICAQQMLVPPDGFEFDWVTKYPPDDIVGNGIYVWRFEKKNVQ